MKRKGCPNLKLNAENCPCEEKDCPRLGTCCECIEFHLKMGELTACSLKMLEEKEKTSAAKAAESGGPRGDDFRLTDYASCAG